MKGKNFYFLLLTMALMFVPTCVSPTQGESSGSTSLSLEPKAIEVPSKLDQVPVFVLLELKVYNVTNLKRIYVKLDYNESILEGFGWKIDEIFYIMTGGWSGWWGEDHVEAELGRPFSGSATMFRFVARVVKTGLTKIDFIRTRLIDEAGSDISHTVSGSTVKVLSFEEWEEGKYAILIREYETLNITYHKLNSDYEKLSAEHEALKSAHDKMTIDYEELKTSYLSLNGTYSKLMINYDSLQSKYDKLTVNYNSLKSSYNTLKTDHDLLKTAYDKLSSDFDKLASKHESLKTDYDKLKSDYESAIRQLTTNTNLVYVLIATTLALTATTLYFSKRKPKVTLKKNTKFLRQTHESSQIG